MSKTGPTFNSAANNAREALNTLIQIAGGMSQELTRQRDEKGDPFSLKERVKAQEEILRKIAEATKYDGEEDFVWYVQDLMRHFEETQTIDGQPIEYWHSIATATLKTNNELIDRVKELKSTNDALVKCHQDQADSYTKRTDELIETRRRERVLLDQLREKERINADLEQQLKSAEIAAEALKQRAIDDKTRVEFQRACAKTAQTERDAALRELDAMREKMKPIPADPHHYFFKTSKQNADGARVQVTKEAFSELRDSAPKTGHSWTVDNTRQNESTLTIYI